MKATVNMLAKAHPYIFFTLQLDSAWHKLPWDEAKTMPCILLQCYRKFVLTVVLLVHASGKTYIDPEHVRTALNLLCVIRKHARLLQ